MRRIIRISVGVTVASAFAVACGGSASEGIDSPVDTVETSVDVDDSGADASALEAESTGSTDSVDAEPTTVAPPTSGIVTVSVRVPSSELDETMSIELADLEGADPVERFAACTGLQVADASTYTVAITDTESTGRVTSFQLLADEAIDGPGVYAATIRVVDRGTSLESRGDLTLDSGGRSGRFDAETSDGTVVVGAFDCHGSDEIGVEVDTGPADGVLDSVEFSARVRTESRALVVSVAAGPDTIAANPDAISCSGEPFAAGEIYMVKIDGVFDNSIGQVETAIIESDAAVADASEFAGTVRLVVLGVEYESTTATIVLNDDQKSGIFSGTTSAGVDLEGAFRCT